MTPWLFAGAGAAAATATAMQWPGDRPAATSPTATADTADPVRRSTVRYRLSPELRLQRADGRTLPLQQALFDGRPVVLSFMYSSCATVCPVTNQTLVAFETLLGDERSRVNTVSVSIDPDHDSVRALADYARRTGGRGSYFTADPGTSEAVQRSFDVWRGDKMNHQPVFLLALEPGRPWVRLDGLVSPRRLRDELARLRAGAG